jgi:hypothetical protein
MTERDRPSQHGVILGEGLAAMAAAGREAKPDLPEMCATCAFRPGCMTNRMASTGKVALDCVMGIDPEQFACHHGMKDGEPTKLCVGYAAAIAAPFETKKTILFDIATRLSAMPVRDEVRERFDAWVAEIDPEDKLDDYARGRSYLRSFPR